MISLCYQDMLKYGVCDVLTCAAKYGRHYCPLVSMGGVTVSVNTDVEITFVIRCLLDVELRL